MSTPTIATAGASNGLLLITDSDGVSYRVPLLSVSDIQDSSNSDVYRVSIKYPGGEITLIYANSGEVATAIAAIDALY